MTIIYNQIGGNYSVHRKADQRIIDKTFDLLELNYDAVLAEIGAGCGNYSNALADKGYRVYAIEPSIKMLSQVKYHQNVKWIQCTAEHIPIKDNEIDGIFMICALHHFQSMECSAMNA